MRWRALLTFATLAACEHTVTIEVSGPPSARLISDTAGGTVQGPESLPWTTTFRAQAGRSVSVVASQGYGEAGEIRCRITVDGALWREARESGPGARVSCHGAVGSP